MRSYRLTPKADADLDGIVKDGLAERGERQCTIYFNTLVACFARLGEFPGLGTRCDDIRRGYRSFPVGVHHIYYRAEEDGVVIVRIRPQVMLPDASMLEEGSEPS
jgi:toxin ParE1/3/4